MPRRASLICFPLMESSPSSPLHILQLQSSELSVRLNTLFTKLHHYFGFILPYLHCLLPWLLCSCYLKFLPACYHVFPRHMATCKYSESTYSFTLKWMMRKYYYRLWNNIVENHNYLKILAFSCYDRMFVKNNPVVSN